MPLKFRLLRNSLDIFLFYKRKNFMNIFFAFKFSVIVSRIKMSASTHHHDHQAITLASGWKHWILAGCVSLLLFVPQGELARTSRVRTNYKLRVGVKPIGRYTPYSQVRIPPHGKYPNIEGQEYYNNTKVGSEKRLRDCDQLYYLPPNLIRRQTNIFSVNKGNITKVQFRKWI